jgi:trigger factor
MSDTFVKEVPSLSASAKEIFVEEKSSNSPLVKEFFVSFPHSMLKDIINSKLKEKQKVAKLPGFRDGQVPFFVIEKKYKDAILAEAIKEKAEEAVEQVTKPYRNDIVGKAEIKNFKNTQETGVEFGVFFEVFPKFEMPSFEKIEIEQYSIEVSDKDTEEQLKAIALNRREFDQSFDGRNASKGDLVTLDFESEVDGKVHRHGSAKNYKCEIGKGTLLEAFENKLIGASKGDSLAFEMQFPEDYELVKEVAGKNAHVKVTIHDVQRFGPTPEINDDFAQHYGCKDVNELKYRVGEIVREGIERDLFVMNKTKLFDALENLLNFEVPLGLFDREYESLKKNQALKDQLGYSDQEHDRYCKKLALRKLRIGILIADYAKINNIKISEQEFQDHVMSQIERQPEKRMEILEYYKNNASAWYSASIEEKVVKQILSQKVGLIEADRTTGEMKEIIEEFSRAQEAKTKEAVRALA